MNLVNSSEQINSTVSSYEAIQLLLSGGLERMEAAARAFEAGDGEGWDKAMSKAIGIIIGLRSSLNLAAGGEIAKNLDSLYEYMLFSLSDAHQNVDPELLIEVYNLLEEIKLGWDGIAEADETQQAVAVA